VLYNQPPQEAQALTTCKGLKKIPKKGIKKKPKKNSVPNCPGGGPRLVGNRYGLRSPSWRPLIAR
jgi:hypothetical protein